MAIRTVFHLELTDCCNFNCAFCKSVRRQNKATLDYDIAIRCMDVMKDHTVHGIYLNSVQFNGSGEALLYPRLDEIIVEARKRFPMAEFVTNGSLLTEERIRTLLATDIDMIEISLTGIIPEVYQHFQGSGIPYDKCVTQLKTVMENVHTLLRLRNEMHKETYIRLRYIRSRELGSYQHFKDYVKYWKNSGVDEIFVTALWDFKRHPIKDIKKLKVIRCHCMNSPMKVNANGEVFSCANNHDLVRYSLGNVNDTDLADIITSEAFIMDKANKMTVDLNRVPKTCLSCECRAYRKFSEEIMNMRRRIFFKKPVKSFFYRFFGIMDICYERFNRNDLFHKIFWTYLCRQSKRIHDDFNEQQLRKAGEKVR
ncbi:radical SAM protein [Butyrivibrio sp. FCS006]|uniref:radical SAM protein n=1 Tax=Butyrivibrio sp. FCS006 TaxID=1280684 RepID=UPI00040D6427|nr:radical SAM protein [Butyrivibrio sp. FCS006]